MRDHQSEVPKLAIGLTSRRSLPCLSRSVSFLPWEQWIEGRREHRCTWCPTSILCRLSWWSAHLSAIVKRNVFCARTRSSRRRPRVSRTPLSSTSASRGVCWWNPCLLYTSDAADDLLCVDLGGRRIIKKKNTKH